MYTSAYSTVEGRGTGTKEGQNKDERESEDTHTDTNENIRECGSGYSAVQPSVRALPQGAGYLAGGGAALGANRTRCAPMYTPSSMCTGYGCCFAAQGSRCGRR